MFECYKRCFLTARILESFPIGPFHWTFKSNILNALTLYNFNYTPQIVTKFRPHTKPRNSKFRTKPQKPIRTWISKSIFFFHLLPVRKQKQSFHPHANEIAFIRKAAVSDLKMEFFSFFSAVFLHFHL